MWPWVVDAIVALGLFVLGFKVGGTIAWYRGWDEGFREGYKKDLDENAPRKNPATPVAAQHRRPNTSPSHFGTRKAR